VDDGPRDGFGTCWWRADKAPPHVYAHRGLASRAFENTLGAFESALEAGVFGIELDVSMVRDGRLVCFHDRDLSRISGNRDRLRSTRFSELRGIPLEGRERVPTLEEAMDVIGPDVPIILDVKTARAFDLAIVRPLHVLLRRRNVGAASHVTVSSTDWIVLHRLGKLLPNLRLAYVLPALNAHTRMGLRPRFARRWNAIHPARNLVGAEAVSEWHERGWSVSAWTVNEPDEARRIADAGADVIISDDPVTIRSALQGDA